MFRRGCFHAQVHINACFLVQATNIPNEIHYIFRNDYINYQQFWLTEMVPTYARSD